MRQQIIRLIASGEMQPGYGLDDGAALHFVERRIEAVVTSRPKARAYRIEQATDGVVEHPLQCIYLGKAAAD